MLEKFYKFLRNENIENSKNVEKCRKDNFKMKNTVMLWGSKSKAKIVVKDERESGIRAFLNYGHTFGHAIESINKYKASISSYIWIFSSCQ